MAQQALAPPDRIDLLGQALAAIETGRFPAAEAICRRLVRTGPDPEAELLLGLALGAQGRIAEAGRLLDRVARARPGHPHPRRDLAELLARHDRPGAAAAQYRACLARRPDDAAAHHALGLLLGELGEIEPAIGHFRRAVELDPQPAMGWSNLGMMLKVGRRFDEAIAAHDAAVARAPEDPQIRVNRAVALLHAGRMTAAWADYEWRLRQPGHTTLPLERLLPDLAGLDLAGRTVLVTHEEGFGDTLQFVRYVPMLAARGARVVLAVPRQLARLMRRLAGVAELVTLGALPEGGVQYEYHCPVFSLPRAFATTLATIPAPVSYLSADPVLVRHWAGHLPPGGFRIGLVWAGQARPWLPGFTALDARRSAGLASFAVLASVSGVGFISLQMGEPTSQARAAPPGLPLHDPMGEVADFADTAAIVANLDLVIAVDTAIVHLAGALGKPVFLLDRYDNCWRWFSGRDDSPWYPRLRIFRQAALGDWTAPMQRVAAALRASVAEQST
ncbi:MAG TPA: tetratricopeptide repeat protein [Acetobacteraceae bacterium]|nr:tetratricopeptide repeat protein [Acetobacteraceae bacterium]